MARLLPDDRTCIKLIKSGLRMTETNTLIKIAQKHNLVINKKEQKVRSREIKKGSKRQDYEYIKENNFKVMDTYEVGQTILLNEHKWTIQTVNSGKRRIYHTINEIGQRESFDCLELVKGNLL